jgi:hypothetical protein
MVLIKNGLIYHVALFNGTFLEIIRKNIEIPKCKIEIDEEMKNKEKEDKLNNLEVTLTKKTEKDVFLESEKKFKNMIYEEFKEKYNIPENIEMDELFNSVENSIDAFNDFYYDKKIQLENQNAEYFDVDVDE